MQPFSALVNFKNKWYKPFWQEVSVEFLLLWSGNYSAHRLFVRLKDSGIILLLAKLLVLLKTARVDVVTQDGLYKAVNIIATCNRNFCNPKKKSKLLKEETDFIEPQLQVGYICYMTLRYSVLYFLNLSLKLFFPQKTAIFVKISKSGDRYRSVF